MSQIREDQKAKLSFKLGDNSEKELDCFVKEISKDRLSLSFPHETLTYADYLREGDEIPVKIFTPSGIRMFNAMILNSPLEPEFVIEYVEDNIQIQRREYPRVRLEAKLILERRSGENIVTTTFDIGGGGVRFYFAGDFDLNEPVVSRLYLPKSMGSIVAEGNVIKKPHLQPGEYVLLFSKISGANRDRIIKKCFEVETSYYQET